MKKLIYLALPLSLLSLSALAQRPVVSGVSPLSATVNQTVTISGTDLPTGTSAHVQFGAARGTIVEATPNQIKAKVPAGASFEGVTVTNLSTGQTAKSTNPFLLAFGGSTLEASKFTTDSSFPSLSFGMFDLCGCDFNSDGLVDVVTSHVNSTKLSAFRNISTPPATINFAKTDIALNAYSRNVICGDLDGDGRPDLIVSGDGGNATRTYVLRNLSTAGGNLVFDVAIPLTLSSSAAMLAMQDLNSDGKPEVLVTNLSNTSPDLALSIFKNSSTPGVLSFDPQPQEILITGVTTTHGISVQDFDGDKLPDIALSVFQGSSIHILRNTSSGATISFASGPKLTVSSGLIALVAADITGDGKPELAATHQYESNLLVWQNSSSSGNIQFGTPQKVDLKVPGSTSSTSPWGITAGDLNGDGRPELVISKTASKSLALVSNTGSTLNLSLIEVPVSEDGRHPLVVDLSGDGKPDLAYTGKNNNNLRVLRNVHCILPTLSPAGPVTLCSGQTILLQATEALHVTYAWTRNGVALSNTGSSLTISEAGDYAVKLISSADGCSLQSAAVQVISGTGTGSNVAMDPIAPACIGGSVTLKATVLSNATYIWNGPNGFTATTTTASYTLTNVQTAAAGSYSVVIKSGDCQFTPSAQTLTVNSNPSASINASATAFCTGTTVTLQAPTGFAAYQWKLNGQPYTGTGATTDRIVTSIAGSYTVTIANAAGCQGESGAVSIAQVQAPVASFEAPITACLQQAVSFKNTSTYASGQTPVYKWTFGNGQTSSEANPTFNYSSPGTYTVNLTVSYGSESCSSNMSKTITVVNTPEVNIVASGATMFCPGESVELVAEGDIASVSWNTGATTPAITVTESGVYTATIATNAGCILERSIEVSHLPVPVLTLSASNTSLNVGESATLTVGGGLRYEWQEAPGMSADLLSASVTVAPTITTTYTVKGWTENGCYATAEVTIVVDNSLRINPPKAFVPAVDGTWNIPNMELYPDVALTIVNSLGNPIYQARPYTNNWDGTEKGNAVTAGVYYYIFKDAAGKVIKTGSITLLR